MNKMFTQPTGPVAKQTNKQVIARHFGVKQSEVVYFSVGALLTGYKVIYDKVTQRAYSLPADIGSGVTAVSLSPAGVLVHSAGSVDLGALAVTREEYVTLPGSFNTGVTVNTKNELVVFAGGKYRWDGVLPKVVPAGSTPTSTGGVSPNAWVSVGDATLRQEMSSETGASMVSRNASPLDRIIRASLFEYLTESDQQALLTTSGAVVSADYALKAAIAAGVMVLDIPRNLGIIELGSDPATLPLGFSLIGWGCRRPYTVSDDSSFLNCGVVIRVAAGASFPFYSTGRHVFRDIVFDGRDKTTYLFYSADKSTEFNGTRLEGCGIYRFAIGIGWNKEGSARYIATVKAHFCSLSGNGDGVKNLIDSMMIGCTINANDRGVALVGGANSNFFGGCRNEWNAGDNWYAYESIENQISGELCDRAGRGGVVAGKDSSWIVTGVVVARSGTNQPMNDNYSANFVIIDNGKIVISGVRTRNGAKEWGQGGTNSPSFNVSVLGSGNGTLLISGSDMTGFVTSALNQKAPTLNKAITGNLGMDDDVNVGMSQVIKGRRIIGAQSSGRLPATVGATLSFTKPNIAQDLYDTYVTRAILIECRIGNTAQGDYIKIPIGIRHETNFYLDIITSGIVASSGRIGLSGTGVTVSLSINSSTGDISVVLTSVDGLVRDVNVSLLPSM
ncbi:tailspike protein [Escherichia phage vB_EcoP_SP5M]|uniref:Tailspike protein n=1 Tax=Escherichia phage vB_EcoP_SP5M TaxID=2750853 RepID=A0A7D5JQB5_9CAUD|nr:tail spike protein [Escherichia phage vB_EcoP_SP5M]QLF80674.1 tailspike protein [Escherichia phage vB_EcoP_SP5M]